MDDAVWVPTVLLKNRERLILHDAIISLYNEVMAIAENFRGEKRSNETHTSRTDPDSRLYRKGKRRQRAALHRPYLERQPALLGGECGGNTCRWLCRAGGKAMLNDARQALALVRREHCAHQYHRAIEGLEPPE
jgi:hypothetical protein